MHDDTEPAGSPDAALFTRSRSARPAKTDPSKPAGSAGFGLSLKGRALRLLAQREHSRPELEKKLVPHEETPGQLAAILDDLQAKDFISEARVVESVINRRQAKFGASRIRQELLGKGLGKEAVLEALAGLKSTELERARELWLRKFDGPAADKAGRATQMRFLAARGFGGDVIGKVLRGVSED
jgi:regulatory protein